MKSKSASVLILTVLLIGAIFGASTQFDDTAKEKGSIPSSLKFEQF